MAVRWSSPLCLVAVVLGGLGCGRIGLEELPEQDAVEMEEVQDPNRAADVGVGPAAETVDGAREPSMDDGGAVHATDNRAGDAEVFDGGTEDEAPGEPAPGGDGCPDVPPAAGMSALIDDLEDGDRAILAVDGRRGDWYTINDGSGGNQRPAPDETFVPAEPGALGSGYAAHMSARGFSRWGAALGVRFHTVGSNMCSYDASPYQGVSFYARGSGILTVSVVTRSTIPVASGGTCELACFDYYASRVFLSAAWTLYRIGWRELRQSGWGTPVRFDSGTIMGMEFAFGTGASFELDVDDLAFF